jgi:hypothetical protein
MIAEEIKVALKNLINAIIAHDIKNHMKWHKVLYEIGYPALPKIVSSIETYNFSKLDRHTKLICISGLVRLVHDIDENAAKEITNSIINGGCEKIISNRLQSINEFTLNNFESYRIKGVTVYEEKKMAPSYSIRSILQKWFENIPKEDIKEIDRIYVVKKDKQDYAGNYTPIFFSIKLVWYAPASRLNPLSWICFLFIENTFYHEVGHHVYRHTFGQDPDQERQANRYAFMLTQRAHPLLGALIVTIARLHKIITSWKILKKNEEASGNSILEA